ncbi:hypothetical protein LTR56_014913 [Elasticomyces elasticus]|nr:hypothetical protein LTR56_014913 [Elasticomyces elasticus]KAK3653276.1 hypothetical protein LTR22_011236 [Elasticomyces elasticus]KAK4918279.1 hypothetical protein LTR49_013978 [Elasticomyces elasticus]KAK5758335.1 hypothetical protein LTS12_011508 [Elasticomyces elasticus]
MEGNPEYPVHRFDEDRQTNTRQNTTSPEPASRGVEPPQSSQLPLRPRNAETASPESGERAQNLPMQSKDLSGNFEPAADDRAGDALKKHSAVFKGSSEGERQNPAKKVDGKQAGGSWGAEQNSSDRAAEHLEEPLNNARVYYSKHTADVVSSCSQPSLEEAHSGSENLGKMGVARLKERERRLELGRKELVEMHEQEMERRKRVHTEIVRIQGLQDQLDEQRQGYQTIRYHAGDEVKSIFDEAAKLNKQIVELFRRLPAAEAYRDHIIKDAEHECDKIDQQSRDLVAQLCALRDMK